MSLTFLVILDCFEMDFVQHRSGLHEHLSVARESEFDLLKSSAMDRISEFDEELLYPEVSSNGASGFHPASVPTITPAQISDFSPDWDFTDGGAKILICLASPLPQPAIVRQAKIFVQFGILNRVPAEKISDTVVRCTGECPRFASRIGVQLAALTTFGLRSFQL